MITNFFNAEIDPDNVEELCKKEPWTSAEITNSSSAGAILSGKFGMVPERFEKAAAKFPEGSDQHKSYKEAFKKAKVFYHTQMKNDSWSLAKGKPRLKLEGINESLFKASRTYGDEDNYISARLLWLAHAIGRHYYKGNGNRPSSPKR